LQAIAAAAESAETSARSLRLWRWRIFASTWLCYAGMYFCRKPYSIAKKDLGDALHFTPATLALIYSAYLVAYTAGQFLSGAIGPRFGPRAMLLTGMAVSAGTAVGFGFADQTAWFVALMILNGLAQATGWSNGVGNMAAWTPQGERGTVMGLWATNFQAGGVLANTLAAFMLARYGFRQAFFSGAVVLLLVMVFFWFNQANKPEDEGFAPLPEDTAKAGQKAAGGPWDGRTWALVLLIGGAYFGMKFIRYALWSWAPYVLQRNFGLRGDSAGYLSTVFDVCGVVGVIALGAASDRLFKGRHALASFVMILGLVGATLLAMTVGAQSALVFTGCMGAMGFTLYGPDALMTGAAVMDLVGKNTVRASGIIGGLGAAGSVLQEVLIGSSGANLGPILGMLVASAVLTAGCLGAFIVVARRPTSRG
jgi:OPA family sugar phosphate sensor protein UhpC-like MFS transporter